MAYVVGERGKKMVMSSAAKKWKDFKLSPDFEAVCSEQSQRREKCEYNHRLSRKGYVGLEDQLEETMPGEEIDQSLLWKKAREDKQGNIPDPKDDLKKQVSEGTLTVSRSNDILTLALGTPEYGGRVRGVGAGVFPTQFFNLLRQQRVKIADKLKESVMEAVREETKKMEARAKKSVLEAVKAEREILLKQFSQLIPNFDPNLLCKTPITPIIPIPPIPQEQSPRNPMSDKASCSNVRALVLEEDNPMNDVDAVENRQDETIKNLTFSFILLVETKLKPANETIRIHIPEEVFGTEHDTFLLCEDILQFASMVQIGSTVIAIHEQMEINFSWCLIIQVCEMDKSWMHADRRSKAYELGVEGFLNFVVENLGNTTHIRCPCVKCGNIRLFGVGIIRDHLYFNGIDQSYKIWTWHKEPREWTTNASRNVEEYEQSRFSFVFEELGMDDNDLGDIGFDPYEFANVIGDGDQPLRKYTTFLYE
ncbi:unnamed protein product [Prunus brigantina]